MSEQEGATGPMATIDPGSQTSVIVDYAFVTRRSTPDSYLTGQKIVEVLESGLRQWDSIPARRPEWICG